MAKLNKTRQKLADEFIAALKNDDLRWKQGWVSVFVQNGVTKRNYRGCNQLYLAWVANEKGYSDPRWLTFNQIADRKNKYHKGQRWTLKRGTKGCPVEYWMAYVKTLKKTMPFSVANEMVKQELIAKKDIRPVCRTTTVFNAENVEGIPEYEQIKKNNKKVNIVNELSENMGIPIIEKVVDAPCYVPRRDEIWIPRVSTFNNDYELNSALLHEFSHASGAKNRLNRSESRPDIEWNRQENYAYEELVAEITSTFMSVYLDNEGQFEVSEEQLYSHKAYVNNWIEMLDSDPNILFNAIGEAQRAADYMEYMGGIRSQADYEKTLDKIVEVEHGKVVDERRNEIDADLTRARQEVGKGQRELAGSKRCDGRNDGAAVGDASRNGDIAVQESDRNAMVAEVSDRECVLVGHEIR